VEWSAEACPNMGLSWPAAQEHIPTTQGAAWRGQTGASTRAGVESQQRLGKMLEDECIHADACV